MSPEAKPPEFTIVRTFDAPRELVWRAWTEDTELAQWLRPFGVTTDSVSFDVRVGGVYTYTMTNDETDEKFPTGGQFLRSEEHTSELQSRGHLVCRLLLEKKNKVKIL